MDVVIGALSLGTITTVINSISSLSLNIYTLTTNIKLSKNIYHTEIKEILMKTDLGATIKLLQTIIIDIPLYYNDNDSIIIALKNMQEIISDIEKSLREINNKIEYNNNIFLMKNLRSYDFKNELKELEIYINILEKRRDNLFKTLELFKNSIKNNIPNKKLLTIAHLDNDNIDIDSNSVII
jgi:predicted  nucleic acid-binding Zn-ribbon protein